MAIEDGIRFSVTLDRDTVEVLDTYARVVGSSRSAVIRDAMRAIGPAMLKAALVVERSREIEGTARTGLLDSMDRIIEKLDEAEAAADDLLESL